MPAKALLVTGASRGIGRACALLAAQNGWAVGVNYREDAKASDAVVETIAKGGGRAVALKGDVVGRSRCGRDVRSRDKGPRAPDLGHRQRRNSRATAKLADMSAERMRRILEVNVLAPFSPPARPRGGCRNPPAAQAARSS